MKGSRWLLALAAASLLTSSAWARWGVSIGIGYGPCGYYRPGWGWGGYYRPVVPVVVGGPVVYPAPVVVQPVPAPVVVQPSAAVQASYSLPPPPATPAAPAVPAAVPIQAPASDAEIERCLAHLANPDDKARASAVVQLGRLHATGAVENVGRVLTSDRSPAVREAAARGLGLIGTPAALPALQQAAQADENAEVRTSARFAVDVIRSRNP